MLVGSVALKLQCGQIRTDVIIREAIANQPYICNVKFSYKQEPGHFAVGRMCMYEGKEYARDEKGNTVLPISTGEEDHSTDGVSSPRAAMKRLEIRKGVTAEDGTVTNYLFQYYNIGPYLEFNKRRCCKRYRLVNFGGFDLATDTFFVATNCGHLLKLNWNTFRMVYAIKMNFQKISTEIRSVGVHEASIVVDMCVDSVALAITQNCEDVVDISTHLFVMTSTAYGPSYVLKINKATGEVIHSSVGSIRWHARVVSIEMKPSTESFYMLLKDMRIHPMPSPPKFFVNMGVEELPVTYGGMIVHGHEPKLSAPLGTDAKLAEDAQMVQGYDGKRIYLGRYYLDPRYTDLF